MRRRRETAWPTQSRLSIIAYFPLFPMWLSLQEVRKLSAQRKREGVGPQRVRESPRKRLCWRGMREGARTGTQGEFKRKEKSFSAQQDYKRAGTSTVHGCAVLTQRLWRQHLKHRSYCGLSDCIPPSSSVDILTHQLTVLGSRALGGTRT